MAHKTRLTEDQVELIRQLAQYGARKKDIADYMGVSAALIQYYTNHISGQAIFENALAQVQEAQMEAQA